MKSYTKDLIKELAITGSVMGIGTFLLVLLAATLLVDVKTVVLKIDSKLIPHEGAVVYSLADNTTYEGCINAKVGELVVFKYNKLAFSNDKYDLEPYGDYKCSESSSD